MDGEEGKLKESTGSLCFSIQNGWSWATHGTKTGRVFKICVIVKRCL